MAAGPELVVPEVMARGQRLQDWWIRNLDPSYREVRLTDLQSVADLAAIVYDAGVQLGAGRLQDQTVLLSSVRSETNIRRDGLARETVSPGGHNPGR